MVIVTALPPTWGHGPNSGSLKERGGRIAKRIADGAYEAMSSFEALQAAHKKARCCKRYKPEVMAFEQDLNTNLITLCRELADGSYRLPPYQTFMVHEPKRREICCLPYRDRVVQRSLCDNVLIPYFAPRLVYDNCACQKGKGTHFGLYRVSGFLREHYHRHGTQGWILKGDITRYFYSIDAQRLKDMVLPRVADGQVNALLEEIINSGAQDGKGIPLGNQTSQWFALWYLDGLDRLVTEKLRVRHYSRYMDDFVLIHPDRDYLKQCLAEIRTHVEGLGLELNPKTQILPVKNGVDYLGFHLYLTDTGQVVRKLRQNSKKNMKRRLEVYKRQYAEGVLDVADVNQRLACWVGHAKHGHTWHLRKEIYRRAVFQRGPEEKQTEDEGR
ncbi:RNA-directed DNA polymerase [Eubacteriales bacterium OttesenSCG-928-N14]|nr:RNA-directed DNA polymerase [Eubacteriales bacterium OttesenSCG-928-N14]